MVYKIELLKKNRYLLAKYRQKSQIAISNLQNIMSNPNDILSLDNIMDKYQYISKCIGLYIDGVSCYGYFVPLNADEYFLLRLSNHNNTNGELYDEHEKDGRPNKRFIIYFIGNDYKASQPNMFQESEHRVINYPVTSLDTEKGVISFCSLLIHLFNKGNAEFGSLESAYNVGQFYKNGNLKGIVAQIDDNGQITLLVDCLNIKDKSIANKKVLKQYGQFVYPFYRTKAYDSSNWRLPTESEGKILLTNYNEINQNIQNIGGKVELIPNKIWAQNNSFIDFEHNQIGISQNDNDCCAIRRVMTIYPNSNVSENNQYKYNRNNMKKKRIRLTEADLHNIVNRSVKMTLNEIGDTTKGQYMLGRLYGRTNDSDIKKYASNRRREQNFGYDSSPFRYTDGTNANPMAQEFLDGIEDYKLGHSIPPKHIAISRTSQDAPPMDGTDHSERQNAKYHMDSDEERWRRERKRDNSRY